MIELLTARVAELERRLAGNSRNSSRPPSADGPQVPPREPGRRGSGRRPGKQPGSPGSTLALVDDPDEVVEHLPVCHHVPVARTAQLIADLTGARPSTGWVTSAVGEAAAALAETEKLIKSLIVLAHVVHVDETSSSIAGARWWLHVAGTERLTAYHLHRSRGLAAVNEFGVLPDYRGIAVGSVALTEGRLGQAGLMPRPLTAPAPRSSFAGFRFPPEVIMLAVRWYLRYSLSYRDVEELLAERGIAVDQVTIYRWVQRFTPGVDRRRPTEPARRRGPLVRRRNVPEG